MTDLAIAVPAKTRGEWVNDIAIPDVDPPMAYPPLILDEGPSVLFGMGESKKSILAQVAATSIATGAELIAGWRPTVSGPVLWLDYESGRRRLARRQRLLGPAPIYYEPCVRPIWDEVAYLARLALDVEAVAVIVDSIVPATAGGAASSKDAETAGKYFAAVNAIAERSLSLAHVTKDGESTMPFGSVFFHNLARLTTRARADDKGRITLTNEKHSDGDRLPPTTLIFDFGERLTIEHTTPQLTPIVLGQIVAKAGTVTTKGLTDAVRAEGYIVGKSWLALLTARAVEDKHLEQVRRGVYAATGLSVDLAMSEAAPELWTNGGLLVPPSLVGRVD
jgi:hypothetical protein